MSDTAKQAEAVQKEQVALVEAVTEGSGDEILEALKLVESPAEEVLEEPKETTKQEAKEETEVPGEPQPEKVEKTNVTAKAWEAVARAEKRNRLMAQQIKKEREELEAQRKASGSKIEDLAMRLAADPLAVLGEYGISYEDLTKRVLNDGKPSTDEVTRRTVATVQKQREELEARIKRLEEERTQSEQRAFVDKYQSDIQRTLDRPEFSLLASNPSAANEILNYAGAYASETGEIKTAEEVAKILQDQWREDLSKLASNKAVREALGILNEEAKEESATSKPAKSGSGKPKSLGNTIATPAPKPSIDWEALTPEQQISEAAKLVPADAWSYME